MSENVAELVKRRREELGMTQGELARRIGVSPAYVSQIETGKPRWPAQYARALAKALDVTYDDLAEASRAERMKPTGSGGDRASADALVRRLTASFAPATDAIQQLTESLIERRTAPLIERIEALERRLGIEPADDQSDSDDARSGDAPT